MNVGLSGSMMQAASAVSRRSAIQSRQICRLQPQFQSQFQVRSRTISSSRSPLNNPSSSPSPSPSSSPTASTSISEPLPLSWPTYLLLRNRRRLLSTICTIPTTIGAFLAGGAYFGSKEMTPGGGDMIFGVEPMFVYAGAT